MPRHINYYEMSLILGRALQDKRFRKKLFADPEATLSKANYDVHPEALAVLRTLGKGNFKAAAKKFKPRDPWGHMVGEAQG